LFSKSLEKSRRKSGAATTASRLFSGYPHNLVNKQQMLLITQRNNPSASGELEGKLLLQWGSNFKLLMGVKLSGSSFTGARLRIEVMLLTIIFIHVECKTIICWYMQALL
jgi:hypothetical protein